MYRRQLLRGVVGSLPVTAAGCTGTFGQSADCTDEWTPSAEAEEPTLAPGEGTALHVEVTNVKGLSFGTVPIHDETFEIDVASAKITPSPDYQVDSYPPKWYWSDCTNPEVGVPVRASGDADSLEYDLSLYGFQSDDGSGDVAEWTFTITVGD